MSVYTQITSNKRRTWLLMAIFVAAVALVGWFWGEYSGSGASGLASALAFSGVMSAFSYFAADKVALAASGAQRITKDEAPRYFRTVENLCIGAGLPMPQLYLIPSPAMNAFATGRDPKHSSIAVTSGLLQNLTDAELEGVLAHELSHIKNYDIRLMTVVVVLVGAVSILASWFRRSMWLGGFGGRREREEKRGGDGLLALVGMILLILAPLIATLIKLAISRKREFLADATSAKLTRYPEGLASALEKIMKYNHGNKKVSEAISHLFISDPNRSPLDKLFATHPPIEERIKILRSM